MTEAWHFVGETLRDGSPIPKDGETLVYTGKLVVCESGYHASIKILDALRYAPGFTCCRVIMGGKIITDSDKLVASERTILWRVDAKEAISDFARNCAKDVLHLWEPPQIVVDFLNSGDINIATTARAAATAINTTTYAAAYTAARNNYNSELEKTIYDLAGVQL